jgi:hypothetical protein
MTRSPKTPAFPVTVTQLPKVRCQVCRTQIPHRPGEASSVLTRHYEAEHLADLTVSGRRIS